MTETEFHGDFLLTPRAVPSIQRGCRQQWTAAVLVAPRVNYSEASRPRLIRFDQPLYDCPGQAAAAALQRVKALIGDVASGILRGNGRRYEDAALSDAGD